MSDLNRIRLLLSDPLLTQSDVEIYERQTGFHRAGSGSYQRPERPQSSAFVKHPLGGENDLASQSVVIVDM